MQIGIALETWFQRLYWANRVRRKLIPNMILPTTCDVQWSLSRRTLREANNPLQRTNLVAWIEFAMHIIIT